MVVSRMGIFAATVALSLIATGAWAAGLEARLGHSVVREGERVELRLRAPADGTAVAPDLSPLEKDFEILGTQQSQRLSVVNGRRESSVDWRVTLVPLRKGELVVPAIHAGAASSEPLRLRVTDAGPPPSREDAPDLFVESTVDQMSPYVQGEVRYTVKVYDGVGIKSGSLSEPQVTNARVTAVGDGRTYEETVGGRRYQVHERDYTITPQKSGKIRIAPVTLEARVADPNARRRSPFDEFFAGDPAFGGNDPFAEFFGRAGFGSSLFDQVMNPGREVRVLSNAIGLDVQARPGGASEGWFLPAKHVELSESFNPKTTTFRVGEAVKRTVVLRALGASAAQLPAFDIPAAPGVRQYDEGSRQGSAPSDDGTVSVREQTVALVPTKPGAVVLPPVEVTWWDAESEVQRTARLPEHHIEVLPAVGEVAPPPAPAAAPAPKAPPAKAASAPAEPIVSHESGVAPGEGIPTVWLVLGGLIALGLAAGGGYVVASRRRPGTYPSGATATTAPKTLLSEVEKACRAGDPAATRDALLRWTRATYGVSAPANPRALAKKLDSPGFEAEAAKLDRSLYAPGATPFDGDAFWRELRAATRSRGSGEVASAPPVLPELYPSGQTG